MDFKKLIIILIISVMMCGCKSESVNTETEDNSTIEIVENSVVSAPVSTVSPETNEIPEENIDLIQVEYSLDSFRMDNDYWHTVSLSYDNQQYLYQDYLKNCDIDLYDLKDMADKVMNIKKVNYIPASEYYDENSTDYTKKITDKYICRTTGEKSPVVSKVKYINHHKTPGHIKDYWENAFKGQINKEYNKRFSKDKEVTVNTPVVIEKSWSFYHQHKLVEIVVANNLDYNWDGKQYKNAAECKIKPSNPMGDILVVYEAVLVFIDGKLIKVDTIDVQKAYGFDYTEYEEGIFTDNYSCYQYDDNGNIVMCQMFLSGDSNIREIIYTDDYAYLDLDGDGIGEILCHSNPFSTSMGIEGVVSFSIEEDSITPFMTNLETALYIY